MRTLSLLLTQFLGSYTTNGIYVRQYVWEKHWTRRLDDEGYAHSQGPGKRAAVHISVPSLSCCGPQYYSRQAGIERKPDELPDSYVSIPHGGFRI